MKFIISILLTAPAYLYVLHPVMAEVKKDKVDPPQAKVAEVPGPLPEVVREKREQKKVKREPKLKPQAGKRNKHNEFVNPETGKRRVVVTGMGAVTPIGIGVDKFWNGLLEGRSGFVNTSFPQAESFDARVSAEVEDSEFARLSNELLSPFERRMTPRVTKFALLALIEAMSDAGIGKADESSDLARRVGGSVGHGELPFEEYEANVAWGRREGRAIGKTDPLALVKIDPAQLPIWLAKRMGALGEFRNSFSACASSVKAIIDGCDRVANGELDLAAVGGGDTPVNWSTWEGFTAAGMMGSCKNPERALLPFDKKRKAWILSEGYVILMVEPLEFALRRGAKIYAEYDRGAAGRESLRLQFTVDETGAAWAPFLRATKPDEPDGLIYFAYSPGTPSHDRAELNGLKVVYGDSLPQVTIASIKGHVGSGFCFPGGASVIAGCKSMETGYVPSIVNLLEPDADESFRFNLKNRRIKNRRAFQTFVRGFGGGAAAAIFQRYDRGLFG